MTLQRHSQPFQAKRGADSSHNRVRTLSAHAAHRGPSSPPSALVAAASCSARSCPSPPQERAQGQSPPAAARDRTAAFPSTRSTQPRARTAPHTPTPGCGAPRPAAPPARGRGDATRPRGAGRKEGGGGVARSRFPPAAAARAHEHGRPPAPAGRLVTSAVAEERGAGASVSSGPAAARASRRRLRCGAVPRGRCGSPRAAASPTGGEAAAESRDGASAAGGLGSLGGGTAPGDGAERGAAAPLFAGRGERRAEAPRRRRLCRAPRPGFAFPFGAASPSQRFYLFIYLFSQRVGTRGGEGRAAPRGRAAWRGGGSPVTRGGGGEEKPARSLASLRLASFRLAHRAAPLPPRLPWPPEVPAAARPHDGLNRHLHQVHRRVPALRGAREVSTQLAGRGAAASGPGPWGEGRTESRGGGWARTRGQGCAGRCLRPCLVPGRCFKGEGRAVRPPDHAGAYSPGWAAVPGGAGGAPGREGLRRYRPLELATAGNGRRVGRPPAAGRVSPFAMLARARGAGPAAAPPRGRNVPPSLPARGCGVRRARASVARLEPAALSGVLLSR